MNLKLGELAFVADAIKDSAQVCCPGHGTGVQVLPLAIIDHCNLRQATRGLLGCSLPGSKVGYLLYLTGLL